MADILRQIDFGVLKTLNQLTDQLFFRELVFVIARYAIIFFILAGCYFCYFKKWNTILVSGLAISLAGFLNSLIHLFWSRPRPFIAHAQEIHNLNLLLQPESFPSNHAFVSFAAAGAIYATGYKKIGLILYFLAGLIATARIAGGVHYPSDVVAGALLGAITVPLAKQIYLLINKSKIGV